MCSANGYSEPVCRALTGYKWRRPSLSSSSASASPLPPAVGISARGGQCSSWRLVPRPACGALMPTSRREAFLNMAIGISGARGVAPPPPPTTPSAIMSTSIRRRSIFHQRARRCWNVLFWQDTSVCGSTSPQQLSGDTLLIWRLRHRRPARTLFACSAAVFWRTGPAAGKNRACAAAPPALSMAWLAGFRPISRTHGLRSPLTGDESYRPRRWLLR